MAILDVSTAAQLRSALTAAKAGDTISLAGGDYGGLSLKGLKFSDTVTIASADPDRPAVFADVRVSGASNLTFDGLTIDHGQTSGTNKAFVVTGYSSDITIRDTTFEGVVNGGYGAGQGLWVNKTDGFLLEGAAFSDFRSGAYLEGITDLTVRDNDFEGIALDGMIVARVHDALIAGNDIDLKVAPGTKHTDGIQFWNTGINDPSTGVTIRGNAVTTHNTASHGIYMANGLAGTLGDAAAFRDVVIEDNIVVGGQVLGIAWGLTDGLVIRDNIVLRDAGLDTDQEGKVPVIRVDQAASDVTITGNATHQQPTATVTGTDWRPTNSRGADWVIADNRIVTLGATVDRDGTITPPTIPASNARADTFRFDGDDASGGAIGGIDFSEGDRVVLINYRDDSFQHERGGNDLTVSLDGTYAVLDSVPDLRELAASSSAVKAFDGGGGALILSIAQSGRPPQEIEIAGMADAYFSGFDAGLL